MFGCHLLYYCNSMDSWPLTKGNHSLSTCVVHLLIVDTPEDKRNFSFSSFFNQPDILLKHRIEQIHVVTLCLDRVREETESLVPHQSVNWNLTNNQFPVWAIKKWHLLHTKDDWCIRNVFLNSVNGTYCICSGSFKYVRGVPTLLLRQHTSSWGRLVCWKDEPTPVEKSWKIEIIVGTLLLRETARPLSPFWQVVWRAEVQEEPFSPTLTGFPWLEMWGNQYCWEDGGFMNGQY